MWARGLALLGLALVGGCAEPPVLVSEAPIPVRYAAGDGGLLALGAVDDSAPFPLLVDTGTVLTSHDTTGPAHSQVRKLRVLDRDSRPRAEFVDTAVLETPLLSVGVGDQVIDLSGGGILGGDLLRGFSVKLDYSTGGPTLSLLPGELSCSCSIADAGRAQFSFVLAGGGSYQLPGGTILAYPPTRVTLDACLQPYTDPMTRGELCVRDGGTGPAFNATEYSTDGRPGVDVRLLVATGFPGVLLGATVWDRLHGAGAADALLAKKDQLAQLRFAGRADPVPAAHAVLGNRAPEAHLLAMALVQRLGLLGACGELNRSRRLRAWSTTPSGPGPNCDASDSCPSGPSALGAATCLQCMSPSSAACTNNQCNDIEQPAAAYIELDGPIEVYVVASTAPILQEANFDVRPTLSDIEGVVGTELLARLQARIDYPNSRVLAGCACLPGCRTYPEWSCPSQNSDCGRAGQNAEDLCLPPSAIRTVGPDTVPTCTGDGGS